MQEIAKRAWMACAIDSEGSLALGMVGKRRKYGNGRYFYHPSAIVGICNSEYRYIRRVVGILKSWKIPYHIARMKRNPNNKSLQKVRTVYWVRVSAHQAICDLLKRVIPYLCIKQEFALAISGLLAWRLETLRSRGRSYPWTEDQIALTTAIRKTFMPRSRRAYGEALTSDLEDRMAINEAIKSAQKALRVIPCQAEGSADSTSEGVETRDPSSTSSNGPHERPAPQEGEDIVQSSEKSEREDKELPKDISVN